MIPPIEQKTADGYDLQFGTNVLGTMSVCFVSFVALNIVFTGHFYFTELLLPALAAGAKTSPDGYARVVTTSSSAAHLAGGIHWETFRDDASRRKIGINMLYAQSKLVRHPCIHWLSLC